MFDTVEVGKKIAELRKNNNMTQFELADILGISSQAVSNWERGNSMPDISKLPEIAELFQVSIEEILGKSNTVLKKAIKGEKVKVTNQSETDLYEAAILMKPQQIKERINNSKGHPKVLSVSLPFLDNESVEELMNKYKDAGKSIALFLPFLSCEKIEELVEEANIKGESIDIFLPFLNKEKVKKLAYEAFNRGGLKEVLPYFPFMGEKDLRILEEKAIAQDKI